MAATALFGAIPISGMRAGQQLLELCPNALLPGGRGTGEEKTAVVGEMAARLARDAVGDQMAEDLWKREKIQKFTWKNKKY